MCFCAFQVGSTLNDLLSKYETFVSCIETRFFKAVSNFISVEL